MIRSISFGSNRFFVKRFIVQHKKIFISTIIIALILSIYHFIFLPSNIKLLLIPFVGLTFFYNVNLTWLPFNKLRTNGIIKIIVVAFVWTGLALVVPTFKEAILMGEIDKVIVYSLFIFIYILMLTISFDQRDVLIDDNSLKTIPQIFQKKIFIFYIIFNIILNFILIIYQTKGWLLTTSVIMVNLSTLLCLKSTTRKNFYYTAFWIEGLPIFWYLLTLFG